MYYPAYLCARVNIDAPALRQSKQNDPKDEIISRTQEIIEQSIKSVDESRECMENLLGAVLQKDRQADNTSHVVKAPTKYMDMAEDEENIYQISQFLNQLQYHGMADRHERITEAHEKTFDWIYQEAEVNDEPRPDFVQWLDKGIGPYWITGKAGSGKSTLMKYLCGNPQTRERLRHWAGQCPLVIVGFFFWSSGAKMQMSQMGLLQTILYESLTQCPSLVPVVFPQQWRSYKLVGAQYCIWTDSVLVRAFELLMKQTGSVKFCFFIDGLDECGGDHAKLVELLGNVVSISDVKICVSSRPWLQFEDAFGRSSNLTLQNLTYHDIKRYISMKLRGNAKYLELEQKEIVFAFGLVEEIAKKASGVWLWVHLVVQSLLDGLTNSDKLSDLEKRLRLTPTDLEDLYKKMLDSIDDFYLENASQLFQVVLAAKSPPSLLGLSFADEEDSRLALRAEVKPLTDEGMLSRCQVMNRRLNSRCKGFLEVPSPESSPYRPTPAGTESVDWDLQWPYADPKQHNYDHSRYEVLNSTSQSTANLKVEFLHRTVKDFIAKPDIWTKLTAATRKNFDPNLALCQSYLLQLKTLHPEAMTREAFWDLVENYMHHAVLTAGINIVSQMTMLNELDRAATKLAARPKFVASNVGRAFPVDSAAHWTSTGPRGKRGNTLLAFLIQYDSYQLFEKMVSRNCFNFYDHIGRPLLDYATIDWKSSSTVEARRMYDDDRVLRNKHIIKLLLEKGADTNHEYAASTPWRNVLIKIEVTCPSRPRSKARWADIVELFMRHGADPRLKLHDSDTSSIIRDTFSSWDPLRGKELENILRQSMRWWAHLKQFSILNRKAKASEGLFKRKKRPTGLSSEVTLHNEGEGLLYKTEDVLSSITLNLTNTTSTK